MGALGPPRLETHLALIQDTNHHIDFYPDISVQGEVVRVPYRIYYKWPSRERTNGFTTAQLLGRCRGGSGDITDGVAVHCFPFELLFNSFNSPRPGFVPAVRPL